MIDVSKISVSVIGERTGQQWVGDFTIKTMLSHRDEIRRDRIRRELLGPEAGDPTDKVWQLAVAFAELSVRVVDAPPFWRSNSDGLDLKDQNVVIEVYKKAIACEEAEVAKIKADGQAASNELRKEGSPAA